MQSAVAPDSAQRSFYDAVDYFAAAGVDVDLALAELQATSLSLHCWQGDDVRGFEPDSGGLGGGLAVTGSYPGRARTADELRGDLEKALSLIPGKHRVNLHAMYGEFGGKRVDRDAIEVAHFTGWIDWARAHGLGLDFNPTCFFHARAADGVTLSHRDDAIRGFWIEHCRRCRKIGAAMGAALGTTCMTNVWIPDGHKDTPVDRLAPRERLADALDAVFAHSYAAEHLIDSVESKLFGIGSESYVVGSHEFYLSYAITRRKWLCLDAGHFHPTENLADKLSAVVPFVPGILLHLSRGVRWDSDHVVTLTDEMRMLAREFVPAATRRKTRLGLDYFDASINRVAAWVIGARNVLKAILIALLEPRQMLEEAENSDDFTTRLALQEEAKLWPVGAIWSEFCRRAGVPAGREWLEEVRVYEREVLSKRG